jgi:hypothetical protein
MSKALKYTLLIHAVVAFLVGAPLLVAPGRFLDWVGWAPVEPIINRILGAALLALAWSSFRGWGTADIAQARILLEMEAAFTILGCVGVLRHLLRARYPPIVWVVLVILAIFAAAWVFFLTRRET